MNKNPNCILAERRGYNDREDGKKLKENPFWEGTKEHDSWVSGWLRSLDEEAEAIEKARSRGAQTNS